MTGKGGNNGINAYGSRVIPNGHSSSTYSTGDGMGSEYMAGSVASFKRNVPPNGGVARLAAINGKNNRQQMPPDGSSSLNPPRSPRFNDRYRHDINNVVNIPAAIPDASSEWFASKEETAEGERESVSGYSRGSGRASNRSGFSGTSWSSRPKSRTATEL